MPNSFTFRTTGLSALVASVKDVDERLTQAAELFTWLMVQHITERAQQNAPILSGDLRAALVGSVEGEIAARGGGNAPPWRNPLIPKHTKGSDIIRGRVIDTVKYAAWIHEAFYNLGPISSQQPMTPEGGVGRRYITRVVQHHAQNYQRLLQRMVSQALGGKKMRVTFNIR